MKIVIEKTKTVFILILLFLNSFVVVGEDGENNPPPPPPPEPPPPVGLPVPIDEGLFFLFLLALLFGLYVVWKGSRVQINKNVVVEKSRLNLK